MFKKPLSNLKTSAPLRSSDRRKLKQRVVSTFNLPPEDGDLLVPEGIQSLKFSTHLEEPGMTYLSAEGDPLWFTIGKGSDDLIPTIYTTLKKDDLLPYLSTPAAVIPVLIGGADLMIPGVIHHTQSIPAGQLVCVRQYTRENGQPILSVPLAIGQMALPSDQLQSGGREKGKAVHVLHTWKDHLWGMGSKPDIPDGKAIDVERQDVESESSETQHRENASMEAGTSSSAPTLETTGDDSTAGEEVSYTPQEITDLLQKSLIQAIENTLSSLPASSFPISSTVLYSNYVLPSRPAFPTFVLLPSAWTGNSSDERPIIDPTEINIKSSTHKSLTTFLKATEKLTLITLKAPQKHSQQTDLLITSVNSKHPLVAGHVSFTTVKDLEAKAAKRAEQEEKGKAAGSSNELEIKELWKPHQATIELFQDLDASTNALYTPLQIRTLVESYITSHELINQRDKMYINLDNLLFSCLSAKSKGKSKGKEAEPELSEFMKRDELTRRIIDKMQSWYEIRVPGKDSLQKKGALKAIQVVVKVRQGRKASTLITGFEPFQVIDAEEMAEDLRKTCAGATSVSPIAGKPAGSGVEVLVQGKQSVAVMEYLTGKGIPKKWIEASDLSGKK